jgi:DNA-binding PadR family transcriptional regulator
LKDIIFHINKVFESRIRLGIMSLLMIHEKMDYNTMKESLNISDGNLANHIGALEREKYISVKKTFEGKKPKTTYAATAAGRKAFHDHLDALEKLLTRGRKK